MPKILIAGASGLVGNAAMRQFAAAGGWEVIGLSRRAPMPVAGADAVSVDLLDVDACAAVIESIGSGVTHFVMAAHYEAPGMAPGWFDAEAIDRNDRMLRNLFEPLRATAKRLQHVSLMQGSKAYGMHHPELLGQIRVPMRELEPRLPHPNFYFVQQDYLTELAAAAPWALTVWRPTVIYGDAPGVNMNVIRTLAIYAALERERGRELAYPGRTYDQPFQEAVDSDLLGRALVWAATSETARDRTFNLTNGDTFTWRHTWATVADAFGMTEGEHRPISFAEDLPQRDDEWATLVDRHQLHAPRTIVEHVGANSLLYADWMLGAIEGVAAPVNSTIAIRQAGFHECEDTETMFADWFRRVQQNGVVPPSLERNGKHQAPAA